MGRPRRHQEAARQALLEAAEQLAAEGGLGAVGVRSAAAAAGTTTRAVYTVFGSKENMVQGLARQAYELLIAQLATVPRTPDPIRDLIQAAVEGFRRWAIDHPHLFRVFFVGTHPGWQLSTDSNAARLQAYGQLLSLVRAAQEAGLGPHHSTAELALIWDAACSGLALREICGGMDPARADQIWRATMEALARGLTDADHLRP